MLYTCAAPVFALDLWMRYWFQVFPARVKGKIVITDRYCTDLMLMQYVPVWFKKIMIFFFPRPTLTFYLYNTPEVLYARREEESVEELERQLGLFLVLEHMIKPIKIKTTDQKKNQEEVFALVMSFIYKEWY
jgi:thymidylate kinase